MEKIRISFSNCLSKMCSLTHIARDLYFTPRNKFIIKVNDDIFCFSDSLVEIKRIVSIISSTLVNELSSPNYEVRCESSNNIIKISRRSLGWLYNGREEIVYRITYNEIYYAVMHPLEFEIDENEKSPQLEKFQSKMSTSPPKISKKTAKLLFKIDKPTEPYVNIAKLTPTMYMTYKEWYIKEYDRLETLRLEYENNPNANEAADKVLEKLMSKFEQIEEAYEDKFPELENLQF